MLLRLGRQGHGEKREWCAGVCSLCLDKVPHTG